MAISSSGLAMQSAAKPGAMTSIIAPLHDAILKWVLGPGFSDDIIYNVMW